MGIFSFLRKNNNKEDHRQKFVNTIIQYLWLQIDSFHKELDFPSDLISDVQLGTSFLYSINGIVSSHDLSPIFRDSFINSILQSLKPKARTNEFRHFLCETCQDFQEELIAISPPIDSLGRFNAEDVKFFCHQIFLSAYPEKDYDAFIELSLFRSLATFFSFSYKLYHSTYPAQAQKQPAPQQNNFAPYAISAYQFVDEYAKRMNMTIPDYCRWCLEQEFLKQGFDADAAKHKALLKHPVTKPSDESASILAACSIVEHYAARMSMTVPQYLEWAKTQQRPKDEAKQ